MSETKKFNIRVYGLLVRENRVLVSDEWLPDRQVTKFPGGGLEWGEGLTDCLKREFREELDLEIIRCSLFYVNDFFQLSAYHRHHQVISVYYLVDMPPGASIPVKQKPFDFVSGKPGEIVFRWLDLDQLNTDDFYFPIDRIVAGLLVKSPR